MRKILSAFLKLSLGVTCCASVGYASSPAADRVSSRPSMMDLSGSTSRMYLQNLPDLQPEALRDDARAREDSRLDVMKVVYHLSYVGAVVLTADRVVRSVDSVLDRMEYSASDGTTVRFVMEPSRRGFDVMVKMSCPLEF